MSGFFAESVKIALIQTETMDDASCLVCIGTARNIPEGGRGIFLSAGDGKGRMPDGDGKAVAGNDMVIGMAAVYYSFQRGCALSFLSQKIVIQIRPGGPDEGQRLLRKTVAKAGTDADDAVFHKPDSCFGMVGFQYGKSCRVRINFAQNVSLFHVTSPFLSE